MAGRNGTTSTETISGQVEATNDKGIRLGGRWFNYSQFGPEQPRPRRGQTVQLQARGSFIKSLAVLEGQQGERGKNGSQRPVAGRETAITRLAVLKAAAEFLAARSDARSADVLKVAERWEAWVIR